MARLLVSLGLLLALAMGLIAGEDSGRPLFCYQAPAGWQRGTTTGLPTAMFEVGDGAIITVAALPKDGGGLLPNLQRWRFSLGLKPLAEDDLRKTLTAFEVDGIKGHYSDLIGPRTEDGTRQRRLTVIVRAKGDTWFFTLRGSSTHVGKQQAAFETFLKSVQLTPPVPDSTNRTNSLAAASFPICASRSPRQTSPGCGVTPGLTCPPR